ncbi:tetratricopeptide repeat protein [Pseudomonas sp. HK3]
MLPSIKLFIVLYIITALGGCAATTPLVLGAGGNHEYLKHKTDVRLKAAAALDEEPDLITYSLNGIVENNSNDVISTYLLGYGKNDYSQDMKSIAIYQIALIYMNRYNKDRDDEKAKAYFHRHLIEFPYSILQDRVHEHLAEIEARKKETIQMTPEQLLAHVDREHLLSKPVSTFDPDLTPMSERAIRENRLDDANGVYLTVYQNPGSSDSIKAKSLYQLGLIYMSEQNPDKSIKKSSYFFRKIMDEFPKQDISKKAEHKLSKLINQNNGPLINKN